MRMLGIAVLLLSACGDDGNQPSDGGPEDTMADDADVDATTMLSKLADTGLCADASCTTVMPGIHAYTPRYELYADGATKRRWIQLPPGTTIDTTDMNHWRFPVGTKVWKEFTRGPTRVETRYITKIGADDSLAASWTYATFKWNATRDDTELVPGNTGEMNANGTEHDIPTRSQCRRCHEGVPGRLLGVNAMSLDFQGAAGELDLADLVAMNLLSAPPPAPGAVSDPYFPYPAAATAVDKAAFGFLHGNCGGCHNPTAPVYQTLTSNVDLRLDVTKLATLADIPARATAVGVNGTLTGLTGPIVDPGSPDTSVMITRLMSLTFPTKMPEIGTETQNADGIAAITAWITQPP